MPSCSDIILEPATLVASTLKTRLSSNLKCGMRGDVATGPLMGGETALFKEKVSMAEHIWQALAVWACAIIAVSAGAAAYSVEQLCARVLLALIAFAALCGLLWSA